MTVRFGGFEDATALRDALVAGESSVRSVVDECLARIAERDGELGAFTTVEADGARERAEALDAKRAAGEPLGALFGVPVAVKSNLCRRGLLTDCSSAMLANYRPPYDATVVERLLAADAVIVGVTNMDEFAMGSSTENSAHGPSRNPWDASRTPGGSSGGSAAAVAAGMVPLALGSDTGGSVRQPASLCGVLGMKPTYGRVSRYGLVAFGSSLDVVSPFARTVRDLGLVLEVISGEDERDATCLPLPPLEPPSPADPSRLAGFRVGVVKQCFDEDLEPGVRARVEEALEALRRVGCELLPIELPHAHLAIPTYYVVATAEASSNLARYDGVGFGERTDGDGSLQSMFAATREAGFGDEVKRRILLGTYALSAGYQDEWYGRAQRVRTKLLDDYRAAFEDVDLVAGPTSPCTAFELGAKTTDPIAMYLTDVMTVPASLAGLPAISVPCGLADGLPVGLQLVAPAQQDAHLLRAARAFELATEHALELPRMLQGSAS